MIRRLVDVERRFNMQPGKLPDREQRQNMGVGWMVSVLNADTEMPVVLRIFAVYGEGHYSGTAVSQREPIHVRFGHYNVLQIISIKEPSNGTPSPEEDLHHAVQAPKVPPLQEVWASLDDRLPGRAARGEARARRSAAHGPE